MYQKAASLVANRLYNNVMTFKGGIPAWTKAGLPLVKTNALPDVDIPTIDAEQLKASLGQYCIVDIRTPKLYYLGVFSTHLKDQMRALPKEHHQKYHHKIPLAKLADTYAKIPQDKPVLVVDHLGKQGPTACKFLKSRGYSQVYLLRGGLMTLSQS